MPYLALNEFDDDVTSFECRDEYLRNGTQYTKFRCRFCEIPYYAVNIYADGKIGIAPHFSLYPKTLHIGDCDGKPINSEVRDKREKGKKVIKRAYDMPEKFVPRREQKKVFNENSHSQPAPSESEIRRRRSLPGLYYRVERYTSSLLQLFVEAKRALIADCFRIATEKKLNDTARRALMKSTAESYPLDLFGTKLNYQTAFWNANTPRDRNDTRIYQAQDATVTKTPNGFEIISKPDVAMPNKVNAIVRVVVNLASFNDWPRAHQKLYKDLVHAAASCVKVKWSVYGKIDMSDKQQCVLTLENLDHLYIES